MSSGAPVDMVWKDGALHPASSYWLRRAEKEFVAGETYRIVDQPERSSAAHNHFFASIQNAWESLPPLLAQEFPSAEHLRKYALIKAGFCLSNSMPCGSADAAHKFAAFMRPLDEFALVTVTGSVVRVFTAKSQSYRSMGKAEFQASKEKCLEVIADMLGATKDELQAAAQ